MLHSASKCHLAFSFHPKQTPQHPNPSGAPLLAPRLQDSSKGTATQCSTHRWHAFAGSQHQQQQQRRVSCSSGLIRGWLSRSHPALGSLEPQVAFLADGLDELLPPVVAGWLLVTLISIVADAARKWCDANPHEPLALEVFGMLPAALEGPTRFAVTFLVATRVLRNSAGLLQQFVDAFNPKWDSFADVLVAWVIGALGPLDQALVSLYTVLATAVTARVLIKWKSYAIEWIIRQQRTKEQQHHTVDHTVLTKEQYSYGGGGSGKKFANPRTMQQGQSGGSSNSKTDSSGSSSAGITRPGSPCSTTAVCKLQGSGRMLCAEMRPRLAMPSAAANDAEGDISVSSDSESSAGAVNSVQGGWASDAAPDADRGSSRVELSPFAGKSADELERLLLPVDGILSWVLVVVSGLFTIQMLGINIQPLLAVGGASSIIIGLATQTLLSNAVTGMSIFLSRPFVAGDSITVQGVGNMVFSGTVERVTLMRTLMRTDDDVLVTVPNKSVSDMVIMNRSRRDARRRFKQKNTRERQLMKFKVKQPQKELQQLEALQDALLHALRRPGVAQQTIEIGLSRFTDAGAEVLVKFLLLVAPGSPEGQRLLMDLALAVRRYGATLVSIV